MEKRIACLECKEHKSVSIKRALLLRPPKNPNNITREIKSENELILNREWNICVARFKNGGGR